MTRWYRRYEGTVSDPKLHEAAMIAGVSRSVAIAAWDALLESAAAKNNCGSYDTGARRVAVILGEPIEAVEALLAAFAELELIADDAIANWKKRQFQGGSGEAKSPGDRYVYVVGTDWDSAVKIGYSKNPWARAKELQTGNASKVEVLAHFRCSANSERDIHEVLASFRHVGEWFNLGADIASIMRCAATDNLDYENLVAALRRKLRSATSLNTTETESETYEGSEPNGSSPRARPWACPPDVDPAHWRDFLKNRKTKRLTNSDTAYQGQLKALADLSDDEWPPGRLVQHAAEKGWAAIHDPRTSLHGQSSSSTRDRQSNWGSARSAVMDHAGPG